MKRMCVITAILCATLSAWAWSGDDTPANRFSANGPMTIGSVSAGEGAPGIVIHELHTHVDCTCFCNSTRREDKLTRFLLKSEYMHFFPCFGAELDEFDPPCSQYNYGDRADTSYPCEVDPNPVDDNVPGICWRASSFSVDLRDYSRWLGVVGTRMGVK